MGRDWIRGVYGCDLSRYADADDGDGPVEYHVFLGDHQIGYIFSSSEHLRVYSLSPPDSEVIYEEQSPDDWHAVCRGVVRILDTYLSGVGLILEEW
jgi:hypothetical protein